MNPSLSTGRPGRLLAVAILILLLALAWLAAASPLLSWYSDRADALHNQTVLAAHEAALVAELPALEKASRQSRDTAPTQDTFFAGETDAIAGAVLEQRLQAITSQIGATLTSAEALPPAADGPYQRVALQVTVTSEWPTFIRLLQTITTGKPTMLIDNLQLTGTPDGQPGVPPINASFTVIAFRDATVHPGRDQVGTGAVAVP